MSDRPKQLTLDDEAATVDAVAEGFDEWSVFRAPMPKRRWRTVDELAARWRIGPEMAAGFLANFQAQGLAEERGGYWRATELARRRFRFLVGFGDEDEAAA